MSRLKELERILEARYELDYAPRSSKAGCEKALFDLVDSAISGTNISRYELMHTLHSRYLDYKREKRKKERVSISERLQG